MAENNLNPLKRETNVSDGHVYFLYSGIHLSTGHFKCSVHST